MIPWSDDTLKLIALDGIDGSGKTTIAKGLVERMNRGGQPTHYAASLSNTGIGQTVRERLYDSTYLPPNTWAIYMAAAITDSYISTILPLLKRGDWVVVDRWLPSYYVYQCLYGGSELAQTLYDEHLIHILPTPTFYFYITASEKVRDIRLKQRLYLSSFDELNSHERRAIHQGYERHYAEYGKDLKNPAWCRRIDTSNHNAIQSMLNIYDILCTPVE